MGITVEVHNLGPLKSAEIKLADLNVLVGDNNTGKTFFATVLHRVLASPSALDLKGFPDVGAPPSHLRDVVEDAIRLWGGDEDVRQSTGYQLDDATTDWIDAINGALLTALGDAVRSAISYAYGAEASALRRRAISRFAPDAFVKIRYSNEDSGIGWSVRAQFDSGGGTVELPRPRAWLSHVLRDENLKRAADPRSIVSLGVEPLIADIENTCRRLALTYGPASLFEAWPRKAIHLPSERSGMVQNLRLLAGAAARNLADPEERRAGSALLTGTEADLLNLLLSADGDADGIKRPRGFASLVHEFEEDIGAGIDIKHESEFTRSIIAATTEGRFPISRASAMLSELAALHLALRFHLEPGDSLTIDEPEAHLHPAAQRRMASFLVQLVNGGATVILTTHSEFFVGQLNNHIRASELAKLETSSDTTIPAIDRSRVRALRFKRLPRWCIGETIDIDRIDGIDEGTFAETMDALYDESARTTNPLLDAPVD